MKASALKKAAGKILATAVWSAKKMKKLTVVFLLLVVFPSIETVVASETRFAFSKEHQVEVFTDKESYCDEKINLVIYERSDRSVAFDDLSLLVKKIAQLMQSQCNAVQHLDVSLIPIDTSHSTTYAASKNAGWALTPQDRIANALVIQPSQAATELAFIKQEPTVAPELSEQSELSETPVPPTLSAAESLPVSILYPDDIVAFEAIDSARQCRYKLPYYVDKWDAIFGVEGDDLNCVDGYLSGAGVINTANKQYSVYFFQGYALQTAPKNRYSRADYFKTQPNLESFNVVAELVRSNNSLSDAYREFAGLSALYLQGEGFEYPVDLVFYSVSNTTKGYKFDELRDYYGWSSTAVDLFIITNELIHSSEQLNAMFEPLEKTLREILNFTQSTKIQVSIVEQSPLEIYPRVSFPKASFFVGQDLKKQKVTIAANGMSPDPSVYEPAHIDESIKNDILRYFMSAPQSLVVPLSGTDCMVEYKVDESKTDLIQTLSSIEVKSDWGLACDASGLTGIGHFKMNTSHSTLIEGVVSAQGEAINFLKNHWYSLGLMPVTFDERGHQNVSDVVTPYLLNVDAKAAPFYVYAPAFLKFYASSAGNRLLVLVTDAVDSLTQNKIADYFNEALTFATSHYRDDFASNEFTLELLSKEYPGVSLATAPIKLVSGRWSLSPSRVNLAKLDAVLNEKQAEREAVTKLIQQSDRLDRACLFLLGSGCTEKTYTSLLSRDTTKKIASQSMLTAYREVLKELKRGEAKSEKQKVDTFLHIELDETNLARVIWPLPNIHLTKASLELPNSDGWYYIRGNLGIDPAQFDSTSKMADIIIDVMQLYPCEQEKCSEFDDDAFVLNSGEIQ